MSNDHSDPGLEVILLDGPDELLAIRKRHWQMLLVSVTTMIVAAMLIVREDQKVAFWFLPDWPAPESCLSRQLWGGSCPGCGLTRSFVFLAHFDVNSAWKIHRVGGPLWVITLLQIPYRIWALRHPTGWPLGTTFPVIVGWTLICLLIVNWLVNLLP